MLLVALINNFHLLVKFQELIYVYLLCTEIPNSGASGRSAEQAGDSFTSSSLPMLQDQALTNPALRPPGWLLAS